MEREYTQEELREILEKGKRDLQESLSKMTPEERAQAMAKAQKAIEEDAERIRQLLETADQYTKGTSPAEKVPPKFCTHCGAPTSGGNFCEYCGKPL